MLASVNEIILGKEFRDEMSRFIPADVQERTLQKDKFLNFLASETKRLLSEVKMNLTNNDDRNVFKI